MLLLKLREMLHTPNVDRLSVDRRRREVEGALGHVRQSWPVVEAVRAEECLPFG
jgi:hypothetical protein